MTATAASAAAPEPYRRCHGDAESGRGGGLSSRHSSVRGRKRLFLFTLRPFLMVPTRTKTKSESVCVFDGFGPPRPYRPNQNESGICNRIRPLPGLMGNC